MKYLFRSLYILFLPRLPTFRPEDVAGTAEYYNRMARQHEMAIHLPGEWKGYISTKLALHIQPFRTEKKIPQQILRHTA